MIGSRLKLARNAAGLSLRALAERMDGVVTAQAIGKYERDRMMPGSKVLLALAKALGVPPDYLLSQRDITLSGIEFRKDPGAGAREERTLSARVVEKLERYVAVEEALGLRTVHWRAPLSHFEPIREPASAEAAADRLRADWRLGIDPIPSVTELLEEHGVKVVPLDLPISVSGSKVLAQVGGGDPVASVVINTNHTGERQRFTLTHEFAHLTLHHAPSLKDSAIEKAMDRFAGAFLVHREELCRLAGPHREEVSLGELVELKKHFKVSLQCLVVRLKQVGVLTDAAAGRHWQELKEKGFLAAPYPEPYPVPAEASHRMHRLALRAVSEGALSESRAAELLGVSARTLGKWLDEGAHADIA
jgi:Zn-dependent peptidase ImmA (M78 family)/DNA-binding XRE family transcriptional regulator